MTAAFSKIKNNSSVLETQHCSVDQTKKKNKWAGHVPHMGRVEVYTGFWWGNLRERGHWEDPGIDGRITLGWIFRKWDVRAWIGSMWLRIGTGGGDL
jgi:hypothetical protein